MKTRTSHFRIGVISDQALYMASNTALQLGVATVSTTSHFGRFAVVYAVEVIVEGMARSGLGELLLADTGAATTTRPLVNSARYRDRLAKYMAIGGLAVGLLAAVLLDAFSGVVIGIGTSSAIRADWMRHQLLAAGSSGSAVRISVAWLCTVAGFAIFGAYVDNGPLLVLLGWTGGALAASELGARRALRLSTLPSAPFTAEIAPGSPERARAFTLDFITRVAVGQLLVIVVGAFAGFEAAAGYRALVVLFGPAAVLAVAARSVLFAEARGSKIDERSALVIGGLMPALGPAIVVLAALLAGDALPQLAGQAFDLSASLLWMYTAGRLALALTTVPSVRLRLLAHDRLVLRLRVAFGVALLVAVTIASASNGPDVLTRVVLADSAVNVLGAVVWRSIERNQADSVPKIA